jgi:hypothetical protein
MAGAIGGARWRSPPPRARGSMATSPGLKRALGLRSGADSRSRISEFLYPFVQHRRTRAGLLALSASAQTTPTSAAITRTIVAATKLPSAVETPSISLPVSCKVHVVVDRAGNEDDLASSSCLSRATVTLNRHSPAKLCIGGECLASSLKARAFEAAPRAACTSAQPVAGSIWPPSDDSDRARASASLIL